MSALAGLWVERYRPTTLDDVILDPQTRALLQGYIDAQEFPHLLLAGPPGTGKTTVAKILARAVDAKLLELNASNERGIEVVREKVLNFARSRMMTRFNVIFFDEGDALTPEAQDALRNLMEAYSEHCRLIFSGNRLHKFTPAIRSRCVEIILSQTDFRDRFALLTKILDAEGMTHEPQVVLGYAERYSDLRQLISRAQKSCVANKGVLGPVGDLEVGGREMLNLINAKDYPALRHAASMQGFDGSQALRALFMSIPDDHEHAARFRFTTAKALHDANFAPDPVITFLGTVAELIHILG